VKSRVKAAETPRQFESLRKDALRCSLPPEEALRRAMMVKPPQDWQGAKAKKQSRP